MMRRVFTVASACFSDPRWSLLLLLALLAWFVGWTFQTTENLLMVVGFAGVVVFLRTRTRPSSGTNRQQSSWPWWRVLLAYSIGLFVIAFAFGMTAWIRADEFQGTSANILQAWVDVIAHAAVLLSLIAWCVWPQRGHPLMIIFGFVAILTGIAGGGISSNVAGQTAGGLAVCVGFCLASQTILRRPGVTIHAMQRMQRKTNMGDPAFMSWPYQGVVLSVFLIASSVLTRVVTNVLPDLQAGVFAELREVIDASTSGLSLGTGNYVTGSKLGDVREHLVADPNAIALRVHCQTVPGYLKGRAFDTYRRSRWGSGRVWDFGGSNQRFRTISVTSTGPSTAVLRRPGIRPQRRFDLFEPASNDSSLSTEATPTVEIHNEPHRGAVVFIPATMLWIEASATELEITAHGMIGRGLDLTQPYVLGTGVLPPEDPLTTNERRLMTSVEDNIRVFIGNAAANICGNASTATEKANRIASHFQNKYRYSLEPVEVPRGTDPVVHFLRTNHPGHCELFATATAMMLRTLGVPTRYLTGYVADSMDEAEEFYVARNQDAHAWVEYYDDSTRRWHPVESTPGRRYHVLEFANEVALQSDEKAIASNEKSNEATWWSKLIGWMRSLRGSDAINVLFQWIQVPLLLSLSAWLIWHSRERNADGPQWKSRREQRRWDRKMRRHGLVRQCGETLHQFADRVEDAKPRSKDAQKLMAAANWYRQYALIRYGGL